MSTSSNTTNPDSVGQQVPIIEAAMEDQSDGARATSESQSESEYVGSVVADLKPQRRALRNKTVPVDKGSDVEDDEDDEEDELDEDEESVLPASTATTGKRKRGDYGTAWKIGRKAVVLQDQEMCKRCISASRQQCVLPLDKSNVRVQRCTYCNHSHYGCSAYDDRENKEPYPHESVVDLFGAIAGFPEYPAVVAPETNSQQGTQAAQDEDDREDQASPPPKQTRTIKSKGYRKFKQRTGGKSASSQSTSPSISSAQRPPSSRSTMNRPSNATPGPSTVVNRAGPSTASQSERRQASKVDAAEMSIAALREEYRYLRERELDAGRQADKIFQTLRTLEESRSGLD